MTITKPTVTNSFTANTLAKASEVNANFTDLLNEFEDNGYIAKGWIAIDNASFEYHASNAIKTTADVDLTGLLQVGDKLTFEQATDGEKFFFITAIDYNSTVANRTYVQLAAGTDYDVDNEAITANTLGFSRKERPWGFPNSFDYVPTYTGFSGTPTTNLATFTIVGGICHVYLRVSGTSNATNLKVSLPVPVKSGVTFVSANFQSIDNGTKQSGPGAVFNNSSTEVTIDKTVSTSAWTASGNKQANGQFSYPI